MKNLLNTFIYLDAPSAWGIYFQDSATPQMEGLVELHDNILYFLVAVLFSMAWIQYFSWITFFIIVYKNL